MANKILPRYPKNSEFNRWLESKIGTRRGYASGPQLRPSKASDEEMERRGYVKQATVGGYEWIRKEYIEPEPANADSGAASIFNLARDLIESKAQWHSGESITIWQESGRRAYVTEGGRDGGKLLYLCFANGAPGQEARTICGHLSYRQGWVFNLTRRDYDDWTARAKRLVNGR